MKFERDDGTTVDIEYDYKPGSGPTYSPMSGADGGDADEFEILSVTAEDGSDVPIGDLSGDEVDRAWQKAADDYDPSDDHDHWDYADGDD